MPRYPDDDYARERVPARRDAARDRDRDRERDREQRERERDRDRGDRPDRHATARVIDDRMDIRDPRIMAEIPDIQTARMDPRNDPRANAAARLEPRPDRVLDRQTRENEVLYRDPRTGQIYQEPPVRQGYARDAYDDQMDYDEEPQGRRTIIDHAPLREEEESRPRYNEYFLDGNGIDREVIQHEICKYLGQDATCRPFRHKDGRQGYLIRAYRAFTTEMIRSLREDSAKWIREREKRARSGRAGGSYAEMRDRQDAQLRNDGMDIDEYDVPPGRHREIDPRPQAGGRHAVTPVAGGYDQNPGYQGGQYVLSSNQPGPFNPANEPRLFPGNTGGNTPPNIGRNVQPPYPQAGFPPRTSGPPAPPAVTTYRDPRTGEMVTTYPAPGQGYTTTETVRPRHR